MTDCDCFNKNCKRQIWIDSQAQEPARNQDGNTVQPACSSVSSNEENEGQLERKGWVVKNSTLSFVRFDESPASPDESPSPSIIEAVKEEASADATTVLDSGFDKTGSFFVDHILNHEVVVDQDDDCQSPTEECPTSNASLRVETDSTGSIDIDSNAAISTQAQEEMAPLTARPPNDEMDTTQPLTDESTYHDQESQRLDVDVEYREYTPEEMDQLRQHRYDYLKGSIDLGRRAFADYARILSSRLNSINFEDDRVESLEKNLTTLNILIRNYRLCLLEMDREENVVW